MKKKIIGCFTSLGHWLFRALVLSRLHAHLVVDRVLNIAPAYLSEQERIIILLAWMKQWYAI